MKPQNYFWDTAQIRLELTTLRLTAGCSAIGLLGIEMGFPFYSGTPQTVTVYGRL